MVNAVWEEVRQYLDTLKKNGSISKMADGTYSDYFRQKTNEMAEISKEEALKDNKHFIIDEDGSPKILVHEGDTISQIIRDQSSSISTKELYERVDEVIKLNNLLDGRKIKPGDKLKVPNSVLPDVTDKLNNLMREHAKDFRITDPNYFREQVQTNGNWDIKSKPGFTKGDYKYYIYDGEIVKYDALGNIHYGYVGQAAPWSTENVLYYYAGKQQNDTDLMKGKDISKKNQSFPLYGDNTDDQYGVYKGITQYFKDLNAKKNKESEPIDEEQVKRREYHPAQEIVRKIITEIPKNAGEYLWKKYKKFFIENYKKLEQQKRLESSMPSPSQNENVKISADEDEEVLVQ